MRTFKATGHDGTEYEIKAINTDDAIEQLATEIVAELDAGVGEDDNSILCTLHEID